MKKLFTILFTFSIIQICFAQNTRWKDYFSYFNILDIIETQDKLICATENGLFTYNKSTDEINKISKVNGLNSLKISAIAYNQSLDILIVAYQSGAINILMPNGEIKYFVDIPIDTDFQGSKAVNHIFTEGNKAVFSMDFGVVLFDLTNMEFDETAYFRNGSTYIVANESVIFNDTVYTATSNGIYSHIIDGAFPNFFGWTQTFTGTAFQNMEVFAGKMFAGNYGTVYHSTNGIDWNNLTYLADLKDINASLTHLTLNSSQTIKSYNTSLNAVSSTNFTDALNTSIFSNENLYGGTKLKGLLNQTSSNYIYPDGPYKNISYSVTLFEDKIWIAPGGRDNVEYAHPSLNTDGFFYFNGLNWEHHYIENAWCCVNDILPNPSDPTKQTVNAYGIAIINLVNNAFESFVSSPVLETNPWFVRGIYDKQGNYLTTQSYASPPEHKKVRLIIRTPQNAISAIDLIPNISLQAAAGAVQLDSKGWAWIPGMRGSGLFVHNYNMTPSTIADDETFVIQEAENQGKLPSNDVLCVAIDKNDNAWIGTQLGLRVFKNPHTALLEDSFKTDYVVIVQNNIPEELLKDIGVTCIAVDEANRKWIGTKNAGLFYVSPTGEVIYQAFTKENSPLPSNLINDIQIDKTSGEVFIATDEGMVSYRSDITKAGESFSNVIPFPNPVRPGFTGNVTIKGLANNAKVKITDITGNLISQGIASGGVYEWNQLNLQGKKVASGIYLVLMINADNTETQTTKIAIVR